MKSLVAKAWKENMRAVAMTDTGNMMAAFHFEKAVTDYNKAQKEIQKEKEENGESYEFTELLPIIGCEFNVCADHTNKSVKDNGYQVVFLAKNKNGYQNLIKLASKAYTDGMYYVPRIDRQLIEQFNGISLFLQGIFMVKFLV